MEQYIPYLEYQFVSGMWENRGWAKPPPVDDQFEDACYDPSPLLQHEEEEEEDLLPAVDEVDGPDLTVYPWEVINSFPIRRQPLVVHLPQPGQFADAIESGDEERDEKE